MKRLLFISFLFAAKLGFSQDVTLTGMDDRRFEAKPIVENPNNITGKIVLDIRANKHGHIIYERAGANGTTIPVNELWGKCENAVKDVFLNPSLTAPDEQSGTIIFEFSQNIKHDTIEYDFGHYNRYIGKKLIFTLKGNDFKGENIISDEIYKAGKDDWPEFGNRTKLYKAQNSSFTLADSLYNKEFICLAAKSNGVSVDLKLENTTTGIFVCEFSIPYCPFQTPEEIEKIKMGDLAQKKVEGKKMIEYNEMIKNPCLQIDESYDDFSRTKKYETGYFKPENPNNSETLNPTHEPPYDIMYYKEKSKNGISYFMSLTANSITALAREKGVIIILKNKKRINKPNAIVETEVNEHGDDYDRFIRRSYIKLNAQDIQLLKQSPIDEFELYDSQVSEIDYDNLHKVFLCLLTR